MEEEQTIHLTDYYHVLLTNKWTVIVSLIIMVSLVLLHNSQLIPIYRATATLIIDKERTQSPLTGQRMDYETYLSESLTFNTHFELITSRPVIERVIRGMKLDQMNRPGDKEKLEEISFLKQFISRFKKNVRLLLGKKKEELPSPEEKLAALVKVLQSMVEIENIEDTRLLNVHVLNFDPVMAKDIANALSQAYIDFNIDNRLKSSQSTLGWLTDHLYGMKKKLEDAEEEFLAYKQSAKLISMARNRRLELDAKLAQLGRVTKSGKDIPHLRSLIENELINDLYGQLVNAEVEFSRISKTYKSKHPKVIQVKTSIDNIGHKLRREIKKELDSLKAEREVLLTRERVLQNTMADFEKEGIEINRKELKYTILKRNVEMNQNLYDTLLSRLKETDITGNIDVSNIRVTEKANLPRFPVSPNKKRNLILGIIFGLMIGIGLSFLREYLDRTLRTEDDIQKYLDLPVLSVIPLADQAADKSSRAKPVPAKAGK
ncbi:MAG: GumC family protein [Deltaproteobacteria bacterium]|nr:GumC family protein [Deltaproteobacteria bacterium]